MPIRLLITALFLTLRTLMGADVLAQDIVYFSSDGSAVSNTRITTITDTKATLTVVRKGIVREVSFSRSRIALAFTKAGNFLIMSELPTDATQANAQLQAFLSAPPRPATHDFLVKTSPFRVIPARIAYENEEVVNYTTPNGDAAAISIGELAAIFYRDGRHRLIAPATDATPLLARAQEALSDTAFVTPSAVDTVPPDEQRDSLTGTTPAQVSSDVMTPVIDAVSSTTTAIALSAEQKELYRQHALARVEEFVSYLSVITDQSVDSEVRDKALESASRLFLPESTIEVTSTRQPGSRRYSVRLYLTRLKLLPYLSARIDWVQTQFVRDLAPNPDGTYSGLVLGQQTFSGYGRDGQPTYSDLTPKYVRVRLNRSQQPVAEPAQWRVLLGNIRVAAD